MLENLMTNGWFIAGLIVLGATAFGRKTKNQIPLVKSIPNGVFTFVGVILAIMLLVPGIMTFGTGALVNGGATISQLQTTTAYELTGTSATSISDSGTDDSRMSVFYLNETICTEADDCFIDSGIMLVTRSGDLKATSVPVQIYKPATYEISNTKYNLIVEDASTGVMSAYIHTSSSAVATAADPRETNVVAFAEGVATGNVAVNVTLDATGILPLTQYDTKDIRMSIGDYPYVFRIVKADA